MRSPALAVVLGAALAVLATADLEHACAGSGSCPAVEATEETLVEVVEAEEAAALRVELLQLSSATVPQIRTGRAAVAHAKPHGELDEEPRTGAEAPAVVAEDDGADTPPSLRERVSRMFHEADVDGNGLLSESELLRTLHGGVLPDDASPLPQLSQVFSLLDTDGSGSLDAEEAFRMAIRVAQGAQETAGGKPPKRPEAPEQGEPSARNPADDIADLLRQRASRNATHSHVSLALDAALTLKEADPRCAHAPEGWLCLSRTSMIYCSSKKRLYDQRECGWKGTCQAGLLGSAGCSSPMCADMSAGGTYCAPEGTYSCITTSENGRVENKAIFRQPCQRCMAWPDGPPPSRRRRTCNGGQDCWFACSSSNFEAGPDSGSSYISLIGRRGCYSDPEDPPYAACV